MVKNLHYYGKRAKRGNKKWNIALKLFAMFCLIIVSIIGFIKINNSVEDVVALPELVQEEINSEPIEDIYDIPDEDINVSMPKKIGKYSVIGQIIIEKINVNKYILDTTNKEALNLSVTKFWGPNVNEVGNLSITGHNYKDLFIDLKKLELGDKIELIDLAGKKVSYEIYDKFIVDPNNVDCIEQDTYGKKEVTLITCTTGGKTRLIIKAKEVFI